METSCAEACGIVFAVCLAAERCSLPGVADCCESVSPPVDTSFSTTVDLPRLPDVVQLRVARSPGQIKEVAIEISPTQPLIQN